ncbi:MAG TPA: hypothetical protein VGM25_05285 [Caulobacteraceae bacterium]|jgi:hypothetical protein
MAAVELERRTVLGSLIALAGLGGAGGARAEADLVDLQVVNRETGQVMPVWRRDGRVFVAGEQGARYSLRIANRTDGRVLVVLSVDGVNIISGQTARYDGRGYILGPYGAYDALGWRKSETEVADFSFTVLPQSYAAQTGRPGNVGVIGMAAFRERPEPPVEAAPISPPPPPPPAPPSPQRYSPKARAGTAREPNPVMPAAPIAPAPDAAPPPPLPIPPVEKPLASTPSRSAAGKSQEDAVVTGSRQSHAFAEAQRPRDEKLGTAHGTSEWSVSHVVPFVRATSHPQLVLQIEYDSYANLVLAGVIPSPPRPGRPPRAFPGAGSSGYVPDPPARF